MRFIQLIYDNSCHVCMNLLAFDGGIHCVQMHTHKYVCVQTVVAVPMCRKTFTPYLQPFYYIKKVTQSLLFLEELITFSTV